MSFKSIISNSNLSDVSSSSGVHTISNPAEQTNLNASFHSAEKIIFTSTPTGTWSIADGKPILTMSGSGTSGCLRFTSPTGENFIATFGVDQNKPWCDIVPNLTPEETALAIHPQYYSQPDRIAIREMHLLSRTVTNAHGRTITIEYTVAEGHELRANLVIG